MKRIVVLFAFAVLAASLASCGEADPSGADARKDIRLSTKQTGFVEGGNDFAFRFFAAVDAKTEKDYVISPLSMQFLLGMLLNGAKGETAEEICKVLGYGSGQTAAVNEFCRLMLDELPGLDSRTKVSLADAIFVNKDYPLESSFRKTVARWYDATARELDLTKADDALRQINKWGSDHTDGLIPAILEDVDPNMLAYLLNAIYFKGIWTNTFQKDLTSEEPFYLESGATRKVQMMQKGDKVLYGINDMCQAVCLPYGNGAYSMYVLLPVGKTSVGELVRSLDNESWRRMTSAMSEFEVSVWMPRFETKYREKLNELLTAMGMGAAFNPARADFTNMFSTGGYLDFVLQEAVVKVDEEGTEAAAVSVAGIRKNGSMAGEKVAAFRADHPFVYLITETSTGTILFAGKYAGIDK